MGQNQDEQAGENTYKKLILQLLDEIREEKLLERIYWFIARRITD